MKSIVIAALLASVMAAPAYADATCRGYSKRGVPALTFYWPSDIAGAGALCRQDYTKSPAFKLRGTFQFYDTSKVWHVLAK